MTNCTGPQDFLLPDNFNVSLVYADTEALMFDDTRVIVKDNYIPLPYLPNLRYFILYNRLATSRFPLNGLLIHNKNHIFHLELLRVNMSGINKADFNGFVSLKYLNLFRCRITTIDKDIFEEIGMIVDAPALRGIFPHLEIVIIEKHDIEELDWAFLSPISRRLKELSLANNKLRSVTLTADSNNPVFLQSIKRLDLSINKLSTLPRVIYESLNMRSLITFDFSSFTQEQQFCENFTGCTCCELYNFTMWRSSGPFDPHSNNYKYSNWLDSCTTNPTNRLSNDN
ncbi:hypothetical protein BV898_05996 [Hypsibius exemplaris]|uniref:Uncharacterized protein n=1 Tax=Hypsibius exemplaris TaxID=2072580 RepID=A0A1W0WXZ6_HYPEX|nr:hypothetical protein BV898_05996 [Hypsibius exemplaris]